jgi:periplasmic divalent cation tolerance protein
MNEALVMLVTCGSAAEADDIAADLVEQRLVAGVTVAPRVRSIFRWQGAVTRETEWMLVMRTVRERFEAAAARIRELHSYEVPEILGMPVLVGNADYADWLAQCTEA